MLKMIYFILKMIYLGDELILIFRNYQINLHVKTNKYFLSMCIFQRTRKSQTFIYGHPDKSPVPNAGRGFRQFCR